MMNSIQATMETTIFKMDMNLLLGKRRNLPIRQVMKRLLLIMEVLLVSRPVQAVQHHYLG
jgi:hypothetical protein